MFSRIVLILGCFTVILINVAFSQTSITIPINSKASYLRTNEEPGCQELQIPCSSVNAPAIFLNTLGVKPGDTIVIERLGAFVPGLDPPFNTDSATQLCAVFSSNSTLFGPGAQARVPGAIRAGGPACDFFKETLFGALPLDIPQDFDMQSSPVTIEIPRGAQFLFVAAPDSFYSDNRDPNHDFAVRITGNGIRSNFDVADVSESSGVANQNVKTTAVQWVDYNVDKRLDLFLVGTNGTALLKNVGKEKFVDVTEQLKIGNGGKDARGATWADFDNDGDPDVFIANAVGPPTLLRNNRREFQNISTALSSAQGSRLQNDGTTTGGIWVDINNDKLIDLFVVKNGAANQLFRHTGPIEFNDIAAAAGVDFKGAGRSAIAADFNNDGFQDIFITYFNQPNKLYLNNGDETFSDVSADAGVAFKGASVQAAVSDFNLDQKMDLFVVNNNGSSLLYRNTGDTKFRLKTPAALKKPKKGVAAAFSDYDLDGDDDLVMAQSQGGNFLFQSNGKGNFTVVKGIDLNNPDNPTGIAVGDFNNDGIPDIAIGDQDESQENGDSLYRNDGAAGNNFLSIVLQGRESNRSAIGAQVLVQTGITFQTKQVSGGNGSSQESLPLEFGLGKATVVDSVRIIWPSKITQTLPNIKVNQTLRVREPAQ